MADKKLTDLPTTASPDDADLLLLEDVSEPETKALTFANARSSIVTSAAVTAAGAGDVTGPASSTDHAVPRFDGAGGKTLQDSPVTVSDAGVLTVPATVDAQRLQLDDGTQSIPAVVGAAPDTGIRFSAATSRVIVQSAGGPPAGGDELRVSSFDGIAMQTPDATVNLLGSTLYCGALVRPDVDGSRDLGTGSFRWRDAHISRDLHVAADVHVGGDIVGRPPRPSIVERAASSFAISDADHGTVIRCTAGSGVGVEVPAGLTPGTTVELIEQSAGRITLIAGSGVTLRHPATFLARTAENWSTIVVTILDADEALVRGDLEAA